MKWRRKNASSQSQPSLITHVFPASWFSKFKQKKGNCELMSPEKAKQKVQEVSPSSSSLPLKEGRFYCGDDDPDWRLSFGDEGTERSKAWRNSAWDDEPQVSIPNSVSSSMEAFWMFKNTAPHVKNAKEIQEQDEKFGRFKVREGEERKLAASRKKTVKDQRSKKLKRRAFQEKREELANTTEKAMFEVQPKKIIHTREDVSKSESRYRRSFSFPNSNLRTIEEDCILKTLNLETSNAFKEKEEINLQCNRLEDMEIKEMMLKTKQERGSVYNIERNSQRKRRKQGSRTRCSSPRTAAKIECKIRALEDMKKAKMRKMKSKESTTPSPRDAASVFESYAVAKSSFNPQKDFRDSMIEMIMEKGIQTPEELEQLLACYLTLNYDEYHDLIIKVFRQVYFELNQMYFASELQHYLHFHD